MKNILFAFLFLMASNSFGNGLQKGCSAEMANQAIELNSIFTKLYKDGSISKMKMLESSINSIKASYCAGLTPKLETCSRLKEEFKTLIDISTTTFKSGLTTSQDLILDMDRQRDVVSDCLE